MRIHHKQSLSKTEATPEQIMNALLQNREITDKHAFVNPASPLTISLHDFGYDTEIDNVITMLKEIKAKEETIVVYTDYDADGITGGAILWETLHLLGFKAFPYVPHRQHEGYGFSIKGIDNVKEKYNPALIISVDHGIAAVDQIAYAKSIGIPIIVTDHHHKQERIPEAAEAIFHIPALSGSSVSYFFSKELFNRLKDAFPTDANKLKHLTKHFEVDYLALASIGTVADLVPLVGPSRSVVKYGLQAFSRIKRKGIECILRQAGIEEGMPISPYEIGFVIAPRINAVGRLEHAIDALRLLCTTNADRAAELANKIGDVNTERQELVKDSVKDALQQVEEMTVDGALPKLLILHSQNWHEGIIGLIASKIVEKYYRPVIVMSQVDGYLKGSARSIKAFHITEFFGSIKDLFMNYGGHGQAAGFTLATEKLDEFKRIAGEKADASITDKDLERVLEVDLRVPLAAMNMNLARQIESLHPFGIGNAQPTFVSEVEIAGASLFGKTNNHLKVIGKDPTSSQLPLEMIQFGGADLFTSLARGQKIEVAYQLDINRWNGRDSLRGRILCINSDEIDCITPEKIS